MTFQSNETIAATTAYQKALFTLGPDHERLSRDDFVAAVGAVIDTNCRGLANRRQIHVRIAEIEGVPPDWAAELVLLRVTGQAIELTLRPVAYLDVDVMLEILRRSSVLFAVAGRLTGEANLHCEVGDAAFHAAIGFSSSDARACLIPDPDFYTSGGYQRFRALCSTALPAWDKRSNIVFWRGSSTGTRRWQPPPEGELDSFSWLQRLALCNRAAQPDLRPYCDIGISKLVQISEPWLTDRIDRAGLIRPVVPREAFLHHRVVVDIDGNSNAWSSLFCSLLSRSCILKIRSDTGCRQWYYDQLVPWETAMPVRSDLADFAKAVSWVQHNDTKPIADAAADLAGALTFEACMRSAVHKVQDWISTKEEFRL